MPHASLRASALTAAGLLALVVGLAPATRPAVNVDAEGLALGGHDVVAYFDGAASKGSPDLTATHAGATYRFATAAHRDAFIAAPAKYLPQYGGYCAAGMAGGYKAPTDPTAFTVHEGRLYLNFNHDVTRGWLKDRDANIAKADANWAKIK
jgi:YHS domain-containing protein